MSVDVIVVCLFANANASVVNVIVYSCCWRKQADVLPEEIHHRLSSTHIDTITGGHSPPPDDWCGIAPWVRWIILLELGIWWEKVHSLVINIYFYWL